MKTYTHQWFDHKSVYACSEKGMWKLNIYDGESVAELYDFIVFPEFRGQGLGNEFLDEAIRTAREEGCKVIVLWPDCAPWVERWYRRKGFAPDARYCNYDGNPGYSLEIKC